MLNKTFAFVSEPLWFQLLGLGQAATGKRPLSHDSCVSQGITKGYKEWGVRDIWDFLEFTKNLKHLLEDQKATSAMLVSSRF